jgi:hypothetical protein
MKFPNKILRDRNSVFYNYLLSVENNMLPAKNLQVAQVCFLVLESKNT